MEPDTTAHSTRAQRYVIPMSMLYRAAGDATWHEGRTENVSRTGVLFRAEHVMKLDTSIEMVLMLPIEIAGETAGTAMCSGRIIRAVAPVSLDGRPALAATILECDTVPRDPRRI
ncbi:MAG: hypothetical protein DMF92_09100 [Acidobacteria bacterium]|nr:MAG: hypothetical protein DMF92_09100 [Acidobacteriota bacterium]